MPPRYVVVDGSNIATEGRSVPSLAQLDEAVRAFMVERPTEQVIVVVDASFGYRIEESERNEYEQAEAAGEIVSPPAGAIGRGDGFLLKIADRTEAVVLSNDSFQEFHAEYPWLFDQGRLIGGKPVPGVGWIFTPRAPVRGPRSREAIRAAKKAQKAALKRATVAEGPVAVAIAEATAEAIAPPDEVDATESSNGDAEKGGRRGPGRRRHTKPVGTVNDPLPFIQFIADHPLGSTVTGEVEGFTSHGAFVMVGGARCYVPLVALATPAPRSAKAVLTRGEQREFVVQALDPPRRGIELALPGLARVAGTPTEETVEADMSAATASKARRPSKTARRTRARDAEPGVEGAPAPEPEPVPVGAAATPGGEDIGEGAPAGPAPVKARRSRKQAAPVEPEPQFEPVAELPVAETPAPATPVAEPPAKARRTRKKAPPVEVQPEEARPMPVAPPEPEPEPVAVPATKARRSRKKAEEPVAAEPAVVEEAPPPAPAKARRTRKKAQPELALEPVPEPVTEPVKKATRKRAPAKKAVEVSQPAEPDAPAPAEAPEPAPVKRTRRTRSSG